MLTSISEIAVQIKKADCDLQIVYGEVYTPDVPDSQNEFMTSEGIREMAHNFMKSMRVDKVDTQHDNVVNGSYVVESFISREGDPDFIPNSWVVGVKCSDEIWDKVKKGEINGFSMEAMVQQVPRVVEMIIPEFVTGGTDVVSGHSHTFKVTFDDDGMFGGGVTSTVTLEDGSGHFHNIRKGTITDDSEGHHHRFSFVELLT